MSNPFIASGYVAPEYFCDRQQESEYLIRQLTNGNNIVLVSPRRMGKTGLIEHCFHKKALLKTHYLFFVDIYATGDLREFIYLLGKEIFEKLKPKGTKMIERFFEVITSLRPAFKLDEVSGAPIFDMGLGEIKSAAYTLDEIFKYIEQADKPCIIAIDEFQQIAKYPEQNIEALLRTHIQRCKNTNFIFSGSERHLMHNIFFTSSRPFYQSATIQSLGAIDEKVYTDFVVKHFNTSKIEISRETVHEVYQLFEGHTWYMQATFNEVFSRLNENETCTAPKVRDAIMSRVQSFENMYLSMLSFLSDRQKEVLIAIAKAGKACNITSSEFVKRYALYSPSSVQNAAKQLLDKDLITVDNKVYQINDRFFAIWLRGKY